MHFIPHFFHFGEIGYCIDFIEHYLVNGSCIILVVGKKVLPVDTIVDLLWNAVTIRPYNTHGSNIRCASFSKLWFGFQRTGITDVCAQFRTVIFDGRSGTTTICGYHIIFGGTVPIVTGITNIGFKGRTVICITIIKDCKI